MSAVRSEDRRRTLPHLRAFDPRDRRAMTLTSQRVLLFERGDLIDELALDEVKRAKVKGSRANRKYQVLEIGSSDGHKLLIEGFRNDIQTFVSALPKFGS